MNEQYDETIDMEKPLTFGSYDKGNYFLLKFDPSFLFDRLRVKTTVRMQSDTVEQALTFTMDRESVEYLIKYLNIALEKTKGD